ncbi:MAG: tRNA (adenosine(37)-N6)-threonylcarbamoyltransferase complex transferase subunit TsaD [marine benthic group bacterium]|jgi:N6-L-threonylcarbamoyladenine synthase|nr:tRNA (adenosine(37)-N6)-threonylcarbamoyltransferase complex transferase subunit TsaD [Candidatus Benthicola marisminoris]
MSFRGGPVLGIESSCDETSAAVVADGEVLGHVILSQDAHALYGGVVPEIAARQHLAHIDGVVAGALEEAGIEPKDLRGVGVTAGPGLVGALLVGLNWAKGFAYPLGLPIVGVHHMEAHLYANSLESSGATPPFVALLVSGGHTLLLHAPRWGEYRLLGATRDDAVGEAFDKVARRLGLGFPGGPQIEKLARRGKAGRYRLPRPMLSKRDGPRDAAYFDFSFSGLKTAVSLLVAEVEANAAGTDMEASRADLAAEFQEAVVDVLVAKTMRAVEHTGCRRVLLGGGVARNGPLRERLTEALVPTGELFAPSPRLSTDNAAMVARLAEHRLTAGEAHGLDLNADPGLSFPGLVDRERTE